MSKRFYRFMIVAITAVMGLIGCGNDVQTSGDKDSPHGQDADIATDAVQSEHDTYPDAVKYGGLPTDYDAVFDNDTPTFDTLYGVPDVDFQPADSDVPVKPDADEPTMEYGPQPVEYDGANTDTTVMPDEMSTDYGPISTPFTGKK